MTDVVRTFVPAESVEEQWDLAGLEKVLREEWQLELPLQAEVEKSDSITDEDIVEKVVAGRRRAVRQQGRARSAPSSSRPSCAWCCCSRSTALARAPGGAGLPAPGHPPARLCAEEPEAGIQARGLRAVLAAARRGQDGSHAPADDRAHPVAGAGGAGGRGDRGARRAQVGNVTYTHPNEDGSVSQRGRSASAAAAAVASVPKVGRNEPCPCGSGKKYKNCHGKLA